MHMYCLSTSWINFLDVYAPHRVMSSTHLIYTHIHYMCTNLYMCIDMYTCMFVHVYIRHVYMHTYTMSQVHVYMHTHTISHANAAHQVLSLHA
jgi:hypothetical protein